MRLLLSLCLVGCAEFSLPTTFPERAAGQPLIQEQALLGLHASGDGAVAELIDAEAEPPRLLLHAWSREGKPARPLLAAPDAVAREAADELRKSASRTVPLLAGIVAARWPEALARVAAEGFAAPLPAPREPGRARWPVHGKAAPLALRLSESSSAAALWLAERPGGQSAGDEVELARMPLLGASIEPQVFVAGRAAWMLAGSTGGRPVRRTVGLRVASLARGEAELHNGHGLADYAAGDLDAARREFQRAIAADPRFLDCLYNAAAVAALSGRDEEAIGFLRRAADIDPRRVQVLGRTDEDLRLLRKRAAVRGLLGLRRTSPSDIDR